MARPNIARAYNLIRSHTGPEDTTDALGPIPRGTFIDRLEVTWTTSGALLLQIIPVLSASPATALANLQAGQPLIQRSNTRLQGINAYQARPRTTSGSLVNFYVQRVIETGPMYIIVRLRTTGTENTDFALSMVPGILLQTLPKEIFIEEEEEQEPKKADRTTPTP